MFQINRKIINTDWFRFDLIRFRKDFPVRGMNEKTVACPLSPGKESPQKRPISFPLVIAILINWLIPTKVFWQKNIARAILLQIPVWMRQFTRIRMTCQTCVVLAHNFPERMLNKIFASAYTGDERKTYVYYMYVCICYMYAYIYYMSSFPWRRSSV